MLNLSVGIVIVTGLLLGIKVLVVLILDDLITTYFNFKPAGVIQIIGKFKFKRISSIASKYSDNNFKEGNFLVKTLKIVEDNKFNSYGCKNKSILFLVKEASTL